jgi:hypothetical protein
MKDIVVTVGAVVGVVALIIGLSALFALPVMWLWNYVVPYQFGLKEIDFLHAWALNLLCSFIFKSSTYSPQKKD